MRNLFAAESKRHMACFVVLEQVLIPAYPQGTRNPLSRW